MNGGSARRRRDSTSSAIRSRISLSLKRSSHRGEEKGKGQAKAGDGSINDVVSPLADGQNGGTVAQGQSSVGDPSAPPLTATSGNSGRQSAQLSHKRTTSNLSRLHMRNPSSTSEAVSINTATDQPPVPSKTAQPKMAARGTTSGKPVPEEPAMVENPLRKEGPRIFRFFSLSAIAVVLTTRFLHWSLALVLIGILTHVLQVQLQISADDSEWSKAEEARLTRQDRDERSSESVEWMNAVLKTVWPLINQDYFVPFIDLLEDALMQQVPGIVHSCRVEDLDQGTVPLRVQSFSLLDSSQRAFIEGTDPGAVQDAGLETSEDVMQHTGTKEAEDIPFDVGEFVNLEITFAYRSPAARRKRLKSNKADGVMTESDREAAISTYDSDLPVDQIHMLIYMAIGLQKIAAVEVPVWCEVLGIEGKMRLRLQMVPTAPFVAHVAFTLVGKPKLEISAKPLGRRMVIDAMHLPIISSYVLHSVEAVVKNFISPRSYTVDIASLLEAQDGPRNVYSLGVIVLVIHQGIELPASDANGKSDPFVSVSFARAGKPLFTTRVLLRTRDPIWHEMAVLLVSPDEVRDQERLRMTVYDADRFSVDDPLGRVDVSIDKLIHRAMLNQNEPGSASLLETQTDDLQPMRRGSKTQGKIRYSVGFFRLSKPAEGGRTATKVQLLQQAAGRHADTPVLEDTTTDSKSLPLLPDTPSSPDTANAHTNDDLYAHYTTGFDRFIHSIGFPLDDEVLQHRKERKDRVKKLTTMMEGEAQATFGPPDKAWRSGILAFHLHSIDGLGFEPPQRSWGNSKRLSAKPQYAADEDVLGEGTSKMPNSYVQVLLNDEAIFRTRTKTMNPQPFINAGSERWVPEFDTARIDFVVRDARQRENDPILGVVGVKLSETITSTCRKTQWYTLTGGLGFGKIRITLLWRSCEVTIPPQLRGWNVGVIEVASCYIGGVSASQKPMFDRREAHMMFETVGGRAETENVDPHEEYEFTEGDQATIGFQWPLKSPVRIAIRQRYPNFLYIHLRSDSRVPGRTHKHAHAVIPLNRVMDNAETRKRVPMYETSDWQRFEQDVLRDMSTDDQLASASPDKRRRLPILEEMTSETRGQALGKDPNDDKGDLSLRYVGYLDIVLVFHSGMAPEHRALMAGDHELRVAFESFQTLVDCGQRPKPRMLSSARKRKLSTRGPRTVPVSEATGGQVEMVEVPESPDDQNSSGPQSLRINTNVGAGSGKKGKNTALSGVEDKDEDAAFEEFDEDDSDADGTVEDDEGLIEADTPEGRRARARNLHRQQRGAAQIKSFRTMQWLKTNAEDGMGRVKRIASRQQSKRIAKMESEGVSHF